MRVSLTPKDQHSDPTTKAEPWTFSLKVQVTSRKATEPSSNIYSWTSRKRSLQVVTYKSLDHIGSKFCLISVRWLKRLIRFNGSIIHLKSQFWEKIRYFPLRNFHLLHYPGIRCFNTLSNFHWIICPLVTYRRLKQIKENFKLLVLKMGTIAYKSWLLTIAFKDSVTWKILVFW